MEVNRQNNKPDASSMSLIIIGRMSMALLAHTLDEHKYLFVFSTLNFEFYVGQKQIRVYFHFPLWRLRFCLLVITRFNLDTLHWYTFMWPEQRKNLSSRFTTKYDTNRPAQLHRGQDSCNFTYRNYKYCYIQVVNSNGADQTVWICRQINTLKFVVRK